MFNYGFEFNEDLKVIDMCFFVIDNVDIFYEIILNVMLEIDVDEVFFLIDFVRFCFLGFCCDQCQGISELFKVNVEIN